MKKSDFYYDLPQELIAQTPIDNREHSRLLLLEKTSGEMQHHRFFNLPQILSPGDCLVMNDTRVLPARLMGRRETTGGAVEVVLLRDLGAGVWECMTRPGKKTKPGTILVFGNGELTAVVKEVAAGGNRLIEFQYDGVFMEILEQLGKMPLPPYIREELMDSERYQTVYSKEIGSAAAPTAGLHFTHGLLNELSELGVRLCYITLHVGLGTFRPVKAENIEEHEMHSEYFTVNQDAADAINGTKASGGRVIAVGSTSCRALESAADGASTENGKYRTVRPCSGFTDIFIYPGYEFQLIDGLITNFHLPESTLIMMVSALAGRDNIMESYKEAVREGYRFFSFGDAMLII